MRTLVRAPIPLIVVIVGLFLGATEAVAASQNPNGTYNETVGSNANTWTNYTDAGGYQGPTIPAFATVEIACVVQGFRVQDGNTNWYLVASPPWNNAYYVSADAFYNNGETSGSLIGTPFVDPAVPSCDSGVAGVPETVGSSANTWTNYTNAGGSQGPTIGDGATVIIACRLTGFQVADGNTWWYQIASPPWNNAYYVSADAFYNNGETSGSLIGTPFVDPAVPLCAMSGGGSSGGGSGGSSSGGSGSSGGGNSSGSGPPPTTPVANDCPAYVVFDSRGSGENTAVHGRVTPEVSPPAAAFVSEFRRLHPSSVVSLISNPYPAVGLWGNWRDVLNLIGAGLGIGPLGAYHASVVDGEKWLRAAIQNEVNTCGGKTQIILIGYSQGAQVTGDVYQRYVSSAEKADILGVVLFGDPYFNPTDKTADRGSNYWPHSGVLGERPSFGSDTRVLSYCHYHDIICQQSNVVEVVKYGLSQHENYPPDAAAAATHF